jgi:predicted O-methyltransferase YrrM
MGISQRIKDMLGHAERGALLFITYLQASPSERRFLAVRRRIGRIEGLLAAGQEKWLFDTAASLPDEATIVEIGVFKGKSTASMAFACRGTKKKICSIDTFNGNDSDFADLGRRDFFSIWRQNLENNGIANYAVPMVGLSQDIGKTWNREIDFLFIDGSHIYSDTLADFELFFPWVKPGGIVALHDVPSHEGPTRVWAEKNHLLLEHGRIANLAFGRKPS